MATAIFFTGLPKAGKSVTLAALYKECPKGVFLERLCPDCEGMWTAESGRADLARKEKNKIKELGLFFSPQFMSLKSLAIKNLLARFETVLFDCGGIPSPQNKEFVSVAKQHGDVKAIIMAPKGSDPADWVRFWHDENIDPSIVWTEFNTKPFELARMQALESARKLVFSRAKEHTYEV